MNKLNIENPSIYVANLGAYNAGRLIGEWLDLTKFNTVETLGKEIDRIANINLVLYGDEWAIHDYSNFPNLGENPDVELIIKVATLVKKYSNEAVNGFIENYSFADLEHFEESYQGEHESWEAWGEELFYDTHSVPAELENYIDIKAWCHDLTYDYFEAEAPNFNVHIFRSF